MQRKQLPADVHSITLEIGDLRAHCLHGEPGFKLNGSISLMFDCETRTGVDRLWGALTAGGGVELPGGWLKDKFGVSWQITPRELVEILRDSDPTRAQRGGGHDEDEEDRSRGP